MSDAAIGKEEKYRQNRAKLSEAAQRVLLRQGYARSSLRDIATEAGVSLGQMHYYFNDKTHLMVAVFRDHQAEFIAAIREVAQGGGKPAERCRRMAAIWTRRMIESGPNYRIWYDLRNQALFDPDLRPVVTEMEALLVDALAALVEIGPSSDLRERLRLCHVPMIGGLFRNALQRMTFGETVDPAQLEASFVAAFEHLLADSGRT